VFTRDDLIDAIVRHLQKAQAAGSRMSPKPFPPLLPVASSVKRSPAQPPPGPRGRLFVTELDIKKRLTAGQTRLTLPADAIVSPLAADWLVLKGITVVYQ